MSWLHTPRKQTRFSQFFLWFMLALSFGLHGLLLILPIPEEKKPAPVKPEEKKVRITQLPTGTKPTAAKPVPVKPKTTPIVRKPSVQPRSLIPSTRPPQPIPVAPTSPQTSQPEASPAPAASTANPWLDFPQYPGAQPGCYNLPSCLQTGKPLNDVSAYFAQALSAKKYSATPTVNERDRTVYQVSRDGVTQYLSLIVVDGKGTLYVLAEAPRTLADLSQAVEVPADIYSVLLGLAAEDASRANFSQPELFYQSDALHPAIGIAKLVVGESYDTFFDTYFRTNLVNSGFEPADTDQTYGGGPVYSVKKDDLLLYINLVPTADGSGTIVVVWKSLPQ